VRLWYLSWLMQKILRSTGSKLSSVRFADSRASYSVSRANSGRRSSNYGNREAMRNGSSHSGIVGANIQDIAVEESMGPIYDRSREHVVPADRAVIRARRLLFECMRRGERGEDPIGAFPATYLSRLSAPDQNISANDRWQTLVPDHVVAENPSGELEPGS